MTRIIALLVALAVWVQPATALSDEQKSILVTGASSGIGAAIAIAFAEAGWSVMAAGRDEGRLAEVADVSENISTWAGELETSADCDELVADTIDEFGRIDCLVNCAGITRDTLLPLMSDDEFESVINVNLRGAFLFMRAVSRYMMRARYGRIINMASISGARMGNPGQTNYSASKGGLIAFTKALALVQSLERELDRRWCLGILGRRGALEGRLLAQALDMVSSPAARRRIEAAAQG